MHYLVKIGKELWT